MNPEIKEQKKDEIKFTPIGGIKPRKLNIEDRVALDYFINHIQTDNSRYVINPSKKAIIYRGSLYVYQVYFYNKEAHVKIQNRIKIGDNIFYEDVLSNRSKSRKRPIKTNSGKTIRRIATLVALAATISITNPNLKVANESHQNIETMYVKDTPEIKVPATTETIPVIPEPESAPTVVETSPEVKETKPVIKEQPKETKVPESAVASKTVVVNVPVTMISEDGLKKRALTEQLYGDTINKYCQRYGMDYTYMLCLLNQERPDDIEEKNIGQFTSSIRGEKMTVSIFKDGNQVGEDKLYVSRSQDTNDFLSKLQKQGFKIYSYSSVKNDTDTNIHLAVAYLSYLVNMKQDLIRGTMSYNAGPGSVPSTKSYDEIIGGAVRIDDPKYIRHILQYAYPDELEKGFTVSLKDGKNYTYKINDTKKEDTNAKENGHHL